jgi:hypothetical protein
MRITSIEPVSACQNMGGSILARRVIRRRPFCVICLEPCGVEPTISSDGLDPRGSGEPGLPQQRDRGMLAVIVSVPTMSHGGWLRTEAPQRPVLFINPLSGGGKAGHARFDEAGNAFGPRQRPAGSPGAPQASRCQARPRPCMGRAIGPGHGRPTRGCRRGRRSAPPHCTACLHDPAASAPRPDLAHASVERPSAPP